MGCRSRTIGNSSRISCPRDDRYTVCNRCQALEIKDITGTILHSVLTRLHHDVGNLDKDS